MAEQAAELVDRALDWLKDHYDEQEYWYESDVVSMLWSIISRLNAERGYGLVVRNQFRPSSAMKAPAYDIAILEKSGVVQAVVEVKYEPSPGRPGVPKVLKHFDWTHLHPTRKPDWIKTTDIQKAESCVADGRAEVAYAILVDESSYHRKRMPANEVPNNTTWIHWGVGPNRKHDVAVMLTRVPPK